MGPEGRGSQDQVQASEWATGLSSVYPRNTVCNMSCIRQQDPAADSEERRKHHKGLSDSSREQLPQVLLFIPLTPGADAEDSFLNLSETVSHTLPLELTGQKS